MPKKRNNGEGTISFDTSRNAYRAAITTPEGERIYKRFKTEQEAIRWKTEQLNFIHKGTFVTPSKITIGEWIIEWLTTYKKDSVRQRTYERYISLAKHLDPISQMTMQEITPTQIQKLYKKFPNLSACTVHKIHKLLKDMWTKAYQLELVQKNIMINVIPPKFEKKEIETFTRQEIDTLLSFCRSDDHYKKYYPMILLGATTGMRLGEILGLRWCDVDLPNATIHIRKSLQNSNVLGLTLETPKTKSSIRKIKIIPDCVDELKRLKMNIADAEDIQQEKLCFITRNGTPLAPRNFERVWGLLLDDKHANIPYKNFHVLRHTHATELLATGIPLSDVAKRLGHSKQSHTLELYSHAMPNHDEIISEAIQSLYTT